MNMSYRRRFIHTMSLLWAFVGLGWATGQMGPSFPDLRRIVDQDLDTASWLFTIAAIGYMVGSLLSGILYDRFNKVLLIAFYVVVLSVFTGLVPWCQWFSVMMVVKFICGLAAGGLDTGGNADIISIWGVKGGSYMQALHFSFGIGGIASPVATEPFLAKTICQADREQSSKANKTLDETFYNSTDKTICVQTYGTSYVHFAYLITFFVLLSSSVPFFIMYIKWTKNNEDGTGADINGLPRPNPLPIKQKSLILALLFLIFFTYCAVEDTFFGYLATFCINYLQWNSSISSYATSLFWTSYSIGRFSGIFLIKYFRPVQLLFAFIVLLILSFVGFLTASLMYSSELVWLFIALVGFAMSITFPCVFSWTENDILQVSGVISSIFLIAASGGQMINPLFLGYLMDNLSPIWFAYILLAESCLCLMAFLIVFILARQLVTFSEANTKEMSTSTTYIEQMTHM